MKKELLYPRALVHKSVFGNWALAWRYHPDTGNHWDAPILGAAHYTPEELPAAHDEARARVDHLWDSLMKGDQA